MDEPEYPCRVLSTRHCPLVYGEECGARPCARFESRDAGPWLPELCVEFGEPGVDPFEVLAAAELQPRAARGPDPYVVYLCDRYRSGGEVRHG